MEAEEGDLGYYPDGNKRTLTDDQIAMFRHSEIYSILRERQIRKENKDADCGEEPANSSLDAVDDAQVIVLSDAVDESGSEDGEEEEYARFLESEQKDWQAAAARNKRKRGSEDLGERQGRAYNPRSTRRVVRELDSITAEDHVLDYGDEPPTVVDVSGRDNRSRDTSTLRISKPVRPALNLESGEEKLRLQGKKIWWPILQT